MQLIEFAYYICFWNRDYSFSYFFLILSFLNQFCSFSSMIKFIYPDWKRARKAFSKGVRTCRLSAKLGNTISL